MSASVAMHPDYITQRWKRNSLRGTKTFERLLILIIIPKYTSSIISEKALLLESVASSSLTRHTKTLSEE